jgi:hypothetical protein
MAFRGQKRGFYTDIVRETGLQRNQAANNMYAFALAAPAEYQALRAQLETTVTHDLIEKMYDIIYAALLEGQEPTGEPLVQFPDAVVTKLRLDSANFSPKFPEKEVAKIAYEAATGLISILSDKVVDKLMPSTMNQLATQKIAAQTSSKLVANEYMKEGNN